MSDFKTDVILVGAGIMSATLGIMIKELYPGMTITILERADRAATESSDAWNNAGTGHSAFCEMNYTPEKPDGSINIEKAVNVAEAFEVSRQFWSYLIKKQILSAPQDFIRSIPHMCFVTGDAGVQYLQKRYQAMAGIPLFEGMKYSDNRNEILEWIPLMMKERNSDEPVAATRMNAGTDVNFGTLTRSMFARLQEMEGVNMKFDHEVTDINRNNTGGWDTHVKNLADKENHKIASRFVFIGAGGGSLTLLLKTGIPEGKTFGGFPVSGEWLRCNNPEVIKQHYAKVYGRASVGTPPMSVPHLDTRMINGEQALLFGPYAGFTTKFLKEGSLWDLFLSLRWSNIIPMISAGLANIPLTKYLVNQVTQSDEERIDALRQFVPGASATDWEREIAGQRVQVIKKDEKEGGILEFGTEVVSSADGSIAALLGASPGASTAVSIMIDLLKKCFPERMQSAEWQNKFREMIPTFGLKLSEHPEKCREIRAETAATLGLDGEYVQPSHL